MTPFKLFVLSVILLVAGLVGVAMRYRHSGSGAFTPAMMVVLAWGGIFASIAWFIGSLF